MVKCGKKVGVAKGGMAKRGKSEGRLVELRSANVGPVPRNLPAACLSGCLCPWSRPGVLYLSITVISPPRALLASC